MWEQRDCEADVAGMLRAGAVLLFIHADAIRFPRWVTDEVGLSDRVGVEGPQGPVEPWEPCAAPTQVQLVDLLQFLRRAPLDVGPRRLAVLLSAWDKAREERLTPTQYLTAKLPLLDQYLHQGADGWGYRVYGVSAQGGEYEGAAGGADGVPQAEELRRLDHPSERIELVGPQGRTHDLTEPVAWLMSST